MISLNTVNCPNCNTVYKYRLKLPVALSCPHCFYGFMIQENREITGTGLKWKNPNDFSVLKLNTKGVYKDKEFELIGRIRSVDTLSVSNEWLMHFNDGSLMWLIENGLVYFIVDPQVLPISEINLEKKHTGNTINLNEKKYIYTETSRQLVFNTQGEIPLDALNDESYEKYEFTAKDNSDFVTVCDFGKDGVEAYACNLIDIKDLELSFINEYTDWI